MTEDYDQLTALTRVDLDMGLKSLQNSVRQSALKKQMDITIFGALTRYRNKETQA